MYREIFLICLCCVALGVSYNHELNLQPCREYDDYCITDLSRKILAKVVKGVPEIGIKSLDPMHQKLIEGNLAIINYTLTNSTVIGFKDSAITKAKLNLKASNLLLDFEFPYLQMVGDYVANGVLIVVPIEGDGRFHIEVNDYRVRVDIDTEFFTGKDGNRHLKFKSFRVDGDLEGGMKLDLTNLFNGRKELGDAVLKFANQYWKPVSKELQGPIFYACIKTMLNAYNKLLKHIPTEQFLVKKV